MGVLSDGWEGGCKSLLVNNDSVSEKVRVF